MDAPAPRTRRIARLSVAVWLLLLATGCAHWQYVDPWPAPGEAPARFGAARVTAVQGGTMLVLRDVEVTADSVIGWRSETAEIVTGPLGESPGRRHRVALHRSQVLVVDRRTSDAVNKAGAAVFVVLLIAASRIEMC